MFTIDLKRACVTSAHACFCKSISQEVRNQVNLEVFIMCSLKTMFKVGLMMSAITGILYVSVPEIRSLILAAAPTLVFLVCPISMLLGMRLMGGKGCGSREAEGYKTSSLVSADKREPALIELER